MKSVYYFLLICFLTILSVMNAFADGGCYYSINNDTLKIGNGLIERQWIWKNGNLYPIDVINKQHSRQYLGIGDVDIKISNVIPENTSIHQKTIAGSVISYKKYVVEALASFEGYDKKIVITVINDSPAIRTQNFYRLKDSSVVVAELQSQVFDYFNMPSLHYTLKSIEFFDRTDVNNNLIDEDIFLPFKHPVKKRGNLLFGESNTGLSSFFIIKEAPCSFVQLNYPGFDFIVEQNTVSICGQGLIQKDLKLNSWVPGYASVVGIVPEDVPAELALRRYQKTLRKFVPERDNMIMMNTWGDRNQDASVSEEFCIREIAACKKMGITHFQIDDGWQTGLSKNSASNSGRLWNQWGEEDWEPHPVRFPNGLSKVVEYANENSIRLGLWFHPSNYNDYENWESDALILSNIYKKYGVEYIKIDGVKLKNKQSELNFRKFLDYTLELTANNIVFNLDGTADNRGGYHYFYEYGTVFLENRYTDWANYYPHWTLRNLWQLSKYVPTERLQIEFLNTTRNKEAYPENDLLAPINIPFDYVFATSMAGQPLAWFEGSKLPRELSYVSKTISEYKKVWNDFHEGYILPVGEMPDGKSWTGFQSITNEKSGYFLVFRENNDNAMSEIKTYLKPNIHLNMILISGSGEDEALQVDGTGNVKFFLPNAFSFALYLYNIEDVKSR